MSKKQNLTRLTTFVMSRCDPPQSFTMRGGRCEACPAGATCGVGVDGGSGGKPSTGFWMPKKDTIGRVAASVTLVAMPYSTATTANFKTAFKQSLEDLAQTGVGTVSVTGVQAVAGGSTMQFTVQVPVSMQASAVHAIFTKATLR